MRHPMRVDGHCRRVVRHFAQGSVETPDTIVAYSVGVAAAKVSHATTAADDDKRGKLTSTRRRCAGRSKERQESEDRGEAARKQLRRSRTTAATSSNRAALEKNQIGSASDRVYHFLILYRAAGAVLRVRGAVCDGAGTKVPSNTSGCRRSRKVRCGSRAVAAPLSFTSRRPLFRERPRRP